MGRVYDKNGQRIEPKWARYCTCGVFHELFGCPLYDEKELDALFDKHMKEGCRITSKEDMRQAIRERENVASCN